MRVRRRPEVARVITVVKFVHDSVRRERSLQWHPVKRPPIHALVLTAILLAGAGVRFVGLGFGLPHTQARPDELRVAQTAVDFLGGDLSPGFFNYPTLFMYAAGAAYAGYCAPRILTGEVVSLAACGATWHADWVPFFIIPRILSALAGIWTIWLVYRIGARLIDGTAALAAALFLAFAFLHVRDSHFGVTDVPMAALVMAAILALVRAHDAPSCRRFAIAGALAGLAASTKYNALFLAAPAIVSQIDARRLDSRLPVFGAAMGGAFLAGSPFVLIDRARFWADATSEAAHLAAGNGIILDIGWRHHFTVSLWYGMTWPLLAAALVGAVAMIVMSPRRAALLLAFPIVYYAVAGRGYTVFARYMIPVVPFLCLTAGFALSQLAARLGRTRGSAVAAVTALALVAPSAWKSIQLDRLLMRTDSRVLAAEWIGSHVRKGSSLYQTGSIYVQTQVPPHGGLPRFAIWEFDGRRRQFDSSSGRTPEWPQWIVILESPLLIYTTIPEAVREGLKQYQLRYAVKAVDLNAARVYDQQDAWFLPLDGFERLGRPGPNVSIYERRD